MGFDLGNALGSAWDSTYGAVGNWLGGNGTNPGALGTGQYQSNPYQINQGAFQNPGAFQSAAGPDMSQYNQTFQNQQGLYNQLGNMASGNGPSVAAMQAQQSGQQNMANQLSSLGAARGSSNPALAQYQAGNMGAQIGAQTQQQAVMGRTAEEMGALNQMGAVNGQMQQGSLGAAGMGMANNQFNAGGFNAYNNNQLQANMAGQQLGVQNTLGQNNTQSQAYNNAATNRSGMFGGAMQGMMGVIGM